VLHHPIIQVSRNGSQRSEARGQKSEVRDQKRPPALLAPSSSSHPLIQPSSIQQPATGSNNHRQKDSEGGALVHDAFDVDGAVMGLDHSLDNGQAESRAHNLSSLGMFDPVELVEDLGEFFRGDADARILDPDFHIFGQAARDDRDPAPFGRIVEKNGQGKIIRVLENEQIKEIKIETGIYGDEGLVEIISGLEEGQEIITYIKE